MQYVFLSKQFYTDYDKLRYPEILQKDDRPYVMLLVKIEGLTIAIPMRSCIKHNFAFFTDKANLCGLDYSKSIIITKSCYVLKSYNNHPIKIRPNEHKALFGKKHIIIKELKKYIKDYKRAVKNNSLSYAKLYSRTTLQYFHKELGL